MLCLFPRAREIQVDGTALTSQTWRTFVQNHARETLACDFFVVVTATFRLVYVFLVLDIGTRRILHWNVTEHPTAEWTVQQFRSCLTGEELYRFIVHDHDAVFSPAVDDALRTMNLRVLKTPVRVPQANELCRRVTATAVSGGDAILKVISDDLHAN